VTQLVIDITRIGTNMSIKGAQVPNGETTPDEKAFANELARAFMMEFLLKFMEGRGKLQGSVMGPYNVVAPMVKQQEADFLRESTGEGK